jgi:nicotinate dehydrogenase subunit B
LPSGCHVLQGHARRKCRPAALHEQVRFSRDNVASVDWVTYPIPETRDAPEEIDVVLLNHAELPPSRAGEPATRTVVPAIANAIYDACGVRVRRVPFTAARIKAALVARDRVPGAAAT